MRTPSVPRAVHAALVPLLVAGSLLGLDGCAASTPPASDATSADSAPCPRGSGRAAADLPHVSLECLTAPGTVEISDLRGKPEVINIWASWCAPCREEMPMLERAHERLGERVQFLGVDVKDSRAHATAFLAGHGISYPQVFDAHATLPLRLRLQGVPNTLFVDASGVVVDRVIGQLTEATLAKGVAALGGPGFAARTK